MDKIVELLKKLGIELTADQTAQIKEVVGKEFVPAADAAKTAAKVGELTKQLSERDSDLEKLKARPAERVIIFTSEVTTWGHIRSP